MKFTALIPALLVSVVCINVSAFAADKKDECEKQEGPYTYLDMLLDLNRLESEEEYEETLAEAGSGSQEVQSETPYWQSTLDEISNSQKVLLEVTGLTHDEAYKSVDWVELASCRKQSVGEHLNYSVQQELLSLLQPVNKRLENIIIYYNKIKGPNDRSVWDLFCYNQKVGSLITKNERKTQPYFALILKEYYDKWTKNRGISEADLVLLYMFKEFPEYFFTYYEGSKNKGAFPDDKGSPFAKNNREDSFKEPNSIFKSKTTPSLEYNNAAANLPKPSWTQLGMDKFTGDGYVGLYYTGAHAWLAELDYNHPGVIPMIPLAGSIWSAADSVLTAFEGKNAAGEDASQLAASVGVLFHWAMATMDVYFVKSLAVGGYKALPKGYQVLSESFKKAVMALPRSADGVRQFKNLVTDQMRFFKYFAELRKTTKASMLAEETLAKELLRINNIAKNEVTTLAAARQKATELGKIKMSRKEAIEVFEKGIIVSKESAGKTLAGNAERLSKVSKGKDVIDKAAVISDFKGQGIALSEREFRSLSDMKKLIADPKADNLLFVGFEQKTSHFVTYIKVDGKIYRIHSRGPFLNPIHVEDATTLLGTRSEGVYALVTELEREQLLNAVKFGERKFFSLKGFRLDKLSPSGCVKGSETMCRKAGMVIEGLNPLEARTRYGLFKALLEKNISAGGRPIKIYISESNPVKMRARLNSLFAKDVVTAAIISSPVTVPAGVISGLIVYDLVFTKVEIENKDGSKTTEIYQVIQPQETALACEDEEPQEQQCKETEKLCGEECCPTETHECVEKKEDAPENETKVYCDKGGTQWVDCTKEELGELLNPKKYTCEEKKEEPKSAGDTCIFRNHDTNDPEDLEDAPPVLAQCKQPVLSLFSAKTAENKDISFMCCSGKLDIKKGRSLKYSWEKSKTGLDAYEKKQQAEMTSAMREFQEGFGALVGDLKEIGKAHEQLRGFKGMDEILDQEKEMLSGLDANPDVKFITSPEATKAAQEAIAHIVGMQQEGVLSLPEIGAKFPCVRINLKWTQFEIDTEALDNLTDMFEQLGKTRGGQR